MTIDTLPSPAAATATTSEVLFAGLGAQEQLGRVEKLARQALPLYGLPWSSEIKLLNYSENATWLVRPPGGPARVLRINRPGYHSRASIASELDWVAAIRRDTPVVTAEPLPGVDGEFVQHVWHPGVPEPRNCVLMAFVEGAAPDGATRRSSFELLGEVNARLHRHVMEWTPPRPIRRFRWDVDAMVGPHARWGRWQDGIGMTPVMERIIGRALPVVLRHVGCVGTGADRFGLIHADLRDANILVRGDSVAVIDFDDCGYSWFIYDLAAALTFYETAPDAPELVDAWLRGYARVRTLSRIELEEVDSFILLRRILMGAWTGSHADTVQAQTVAAEGYAEGTCLLAERYLSRFS